MLNLGWHGKIIRWYCRVRAVQTYYTMLISFIIPAFNSSGTIIRCLDSIYGLPVNKLDFEVIVIDDCSTDNTIGVVREYALQRPNLVLLCQPENHLQCSARNRGVVIAQGKYIVFVDSDDESSKGVISAVQLAEENGLDMVAMRYVKIDNDGVVVREENLPYNKADLFAGKEMQTQFPFWGTAPWPYVYQKSFMDKVNYPFAEDVLFEDTDFVNVHLFFAKRMMYCDECGYAMHYNAESTTHTISYKHLADYALLGTRMLRFYESLDNKNDKYAETILEGGSFNIMKALRKLPRLKSRSDVKAFYDRFDACYDRKTLLGYRKPAYCWTQWTRFCLKHRKLATMLMGIAVLLVKKGVKS